MESFSVLRSIVGKTIVLNLDERKDRLSETALELKKLSLSFERFSAIKSEDGWKGYNESILQVLNQNRDVENLFLVEDDCKLVGDLTIIEKGILGLPSNWDALWLGSNLQAVHTDKHSEHLYRLKNGWNTHAIIMTQKFREWCLKEWDRVMIFDEFLRVVAQDKKECFVLYPMVAIQRESYSNIMKQHVNYEPTFHNANYMFA